jgi:hypothetical protein
VRIALVYQRPGCANLSTIQTTQMFRLYSSYLLTAKAPHRHRRSLISYHLLSKFLIGGPHGTISTWGCCGACGDEPTLPEPDSAKDGVRCRLSQSDHSVCLWKSNCRSESSSSVSDALYSEESFVDNSTWHAESRVPPINGSSPFSVLVSRTSAFGVETQTCVRDEQIQRWISPLSWLCASDEILLYSRSNILNHG